MCFFLFSYLDSDAVDIQFLALNSKSPKELGKWESNEKLAFFITEFLINEVNFNPNIHEVNNINKVKKPAFYKDYLVGDWIIEKKGAWLQEEASIVFNLKNKPKNDVVFSFNYDALLYSVLQPNIDIQIFVNNKHVTDLHIVNSGQLSFIIPKEFFDNEVIRIQFTALNAKSPQYLKKWDFDGILSIFIHNFQLNEKK